MTLTKIIKLLIDIGMRIVPLLAVIAFLMFVLGVGKYIRSTGSEKDNKDSKNLLIWGIIGVFLLVTVWGVIAFLRSELGFTGGVGVPQININ
jgi:hypothetical protein